MKFLSKTLYLFFLIMLFSCSINSQSNNQDYQLKIEYLTNLDAQLNESSGMAFYKNFLITMNDGNNSNKIFAFDSLNGKVIKSFSIKNAVNNDWEEITVSNDGVLFIGDFGNNKGNRKDLAVLKVLPINNSNSIDSLYCEKINFSYPNQIDFSERKDHSYNCEAMFHFKNKLYIFTKNKPEKITDLYSLPDSPGDYSAKKITSFNSKCLITAAAITKDYSRICLLGYNKNDDVFLWILENFKDENFFSGKNSMIKLGSFEEFGQAESVVFINNNTLFISAEKTNNQAPKLYKITLLKN